MRVVIALGGNALGSNAEEQRELVKKTASAIADVVEEGHEVLISHGNGPQVGMIHSAMEQENMPFPECGAMSQGYIGFHLQNAMQNEFRLRGIKRTVVSIVTQVVVDKEDPAFENPTKPIGSFMDQATADYLAKRKGHTFVEDSGRGYRRVVASPKPQDIVEKEAIKEMVDAGHVIIAGGGGGIPVVDKEEGYTGVPAVIDKDFASSKIADILNADVLCILTAVDYVSLHFNTPQQTDLKDIRVSELKALIDEGHFAKGSMLPKVEAALRFVEGEKNRKGIIASLENAVDALRQNTGTIIEN